MGYPKPRFSNELNKKLKEQLWHDVYARRSVYFARDPRAEERPKAVWTALRGTMKIILNGIGWLFRRENLLYTNVLLSSSLSLTGDVLEQRLEKYRGELETWDRARTAKMTATGLPIGVYCHYYYIMLDRYFPGRSLGILARKIFVDQFVCSPMCIAGFLAMMAVMNGSSWNCFVDDLAAKGARLYKADWIVWPPAQVINFYFLPPKYRVLYDNVISLGFDVYTSHVNYAPAKS